MIDREELERLHEAGAVTLNECPPGLFMFGHCLGFKSEYVTTLENPRRYQVDAYVVASGEYFHGGARGTEQRGNLVVQPLDCETIATLLTERDTLAAENARLHEAAGALDVVAWMYEWAGPNPKDVTQFRQIRPSGPLKQGWTETPLTDLNKANKIIATLASENAALTEKVERLEGALRPFVRDLAWVEEDDAPLRIANSHTASGYDIAWDEVVQARAALKREEG